MHIPNRVSWSVVPDLASPIPLGRHAALLLCLARRLRLRAQQWYRAHTAEAELASMSDSMLADIGVSRCEVARFARRGRGE
ncbi:DUF1127 domain-containing protein [Belnapia sp. T18]|uniref:DUF1127 domain-containing protein n=1 Tax=Belnapia arida TaxID=2804533 RepID=A0ABS1TWQ3_9PROT|nr:DUF1127 domain-containing protein [Belnapia arida]